MFIGGVRSVIMMCVPNAKGLKRISVSLVIHFSTRDSISIHTIDVIYALNMELSRDGIASAISIYAFNVLINDLDVNSLLSSNFTKLNRDKSFAIITVSLLLIT